MRGDRCVESRSETIDCAVSLIQAIYDADGSIAIKELMAMTLREFITTVAAQNNIRFIFEKPNDNKTITEARVYKSKEEELRYKNASRLKISSDHPAIGVGYRKLRDDEVIEATDEYAHVSLLLVQPYMNSWKVVPQDNIGTTVSYQCSEECPNADCHEMIYKRNLKQHKPSSGRSQARDIHNILNACAVPVGQFRQNL